MYKRRVIVLAGIPGAGKSTLAAHLAQDFLGQSAQNRARIFAADDHMVDEQGRYRFDSRRLTECHGVNLERFTRALLRLDDSPPDLMVVDNTACAAHEVAPYAELALSQGAALRTLVVLCDPEVASARCIHDVDPAHVYRRHLQLTREYPKFPPRWNVDVVWNNQPSL